MRNGLEHGFDLERSAGDDWCEDVRLETDSPPDSIVTAAAEPEQCGGTLALKIEKYC